MQEGPAVDEPWAEDELARPEPAIREEPPAAEVPRLDYELAAEAPRNDAHVEPPVALTERGVPDGFNLPDLAARARDIADFIAGQAAVTREYERRIAEFEAELAETRATTQETKTQLAAVLQLLDVLKPSV